MQPTVFTMKRTLALLSAVPILAAAAATDNEIVLLQPSSPATVNAAAGDDTYVLAYFLMSGNEKLTISDTEGNNVVQLPDGLPILSSSVLDNQLVLTLTHGAQITIAQAPTFQYDLGGNAAAGINHEPVSFTVLAQKTLGIKLPTTGSATGGGVIIQAASKAKQTIGAINVTPNTLTIGSTTTVNAIASSGLRVTFSTTTPKICNTSGQYGNTVTGVAVGTCIIAANQSGNDTFKAATQLTQKITVKAVAPLPKIAIADATVQENSSTAVVPVTLSTAATKTVTVNYSLANGSAVAGKDYTTKSGTVRFTAGNTRQTITLAITNDTLAENSETFAVNLYGATNATIQRKTATVTITDDDTLNDLVWDTGLWDKALWK